jgi:uncharacterized membrane protein YhdT
MIWAIALSVEYYLSVFVCGAYLPETKTIFVVENDWFDGFRMFQHCVFNSYWWDELAVASCSANDLVATTCCGDITRYV